MSDFQAMPPQRTNGMAIAGFVTALLCCSPLGIIFSAIGLSQIGKDPAQQGKGLAIAGLIIGIISLIGGLIWLFAYSAWFGATVDSYDYGY
jgi:hypothetical protein